MSESKTPASLSVLLQPDTNNVKYDTVEAYGTQVRIGSVSSADMLEWVEGNADPQKRKRAGLRLLVKSIVDAEGNRFPTETADAPGYEAAVAAFAAKDAQENGKVLAKVFLLNGFPNPKDEAQAPQGATARKND